MSKKVKYTIVAVVIPWFLAFAQDKKPPVPIQPSNNSNTAQSSEDDEDDSEASASGLKVMIIPFNPSYYETDVDSDYADAEDNKKVEQAKDFAKFGVEKNVKARIVSNGGKKKNGLNESTDSDNDISKIYENITYQYEKRDNRYEQKNSLIGGLLKKLQGSDKAKQAYQSDDKHKEYMNVTILDPELLPKIAKKYGVAIFVFINQYEIFTNYKKIIDPVNKVYQRQIKLHFSIFDATGQQIYGDVALLSFQGLSKDIDEVILNRFPVVANYVANPKNASANGASSTTTDADTDSDTETNTTPSTKPDSDATPNADIKTNINNPKTEKSKPVSKPPEQPQPKKQKSDENDEDKDGGSSKP